jgi:GNAT superfamily N-acetyltransferase
MLVKIEPESLSLTKECAEAFFNESKIPGALHFEYWKKRWNEYISNGIGVIIASMVDGKVIGMIGGLVYPCMMTGRQEAVEAFWYMLPDYRKGTYGIKLLQSFEEWAKFNNAVQMKMIHMAHIDPEKIQSMYERMGYKKIEVGFIKELKASLI